MLPARGGPRSSTAWRAPGRKLARRVRSAGERRTGVRVGSAREREPENHDTGGDL
jgi:hypothetical protein